MKITKRLIPQFIYVPLVKWKDYMKFEWLRRKILTYYGKNPPDTSDKGKIDALDFLKANRITYFPYNFTLKYHPDNFEIFFDSEKQMYYVLYENQSRLYLKKKYTEKEAREYYHSIRIEQDVNSPHRYMSSDFYVSENDVVADVGGAEGIFALDSLHRNASKAYIFEPDNEWLEPLKATFEPWKDRVEIIQKFVSDRNDDKNISLDSFFSGKKLPDMVKLDVEGMERSVFAGAKKILDHSPQKIATCTYHRHNDDVEFPKMLADKGYKTFVSPNYMLTIDDNLRAPFFRRGLVFGIKTNEK
ncbi:hypothetical protein FACS1894174_04270 [Bacteroidia bacterium]|nr:hypothetical protein FACS1894174_04270 [Bacteroidia bacterium]